MKRSLALLVGLSVLTASGCEEPASAQEAALYEELETRSLPADFCEQLFTYEHMVATADGTQLRVTEAFSPASVFRFPRRAVLMMPGTLVSGDQWNMDVDESGDFNALKRAAREGYFAYSVTYEGYPGSEQPLDGSTVTAERSLTQMGEIVEWIRAQRYVAKVDLFGTSFGSSLATALGGTQSPIPRWHIGRVVLQALVYKEVTPLFEEVFFSPEVLALLESAPNGYIMTAPEMYGLILIAADPAAAAFAFANYPDVYATGPTLSGFDLPVFEASYGRAPLLQFLGDADPITPMSDALAFQSEYGGSADLVVLPGAGHAPYIGNESTREVFWSESLEFLDYSSFNFFLACEP